VISLPWRLIVWPSSNFHNVPQALGWQTCVVGVSGCLVGRPETRNVDFPTPRLEAARAIELAPPVVLG